MKEPRLKQIPVITIKSLEQTKSELLFFFYSAGEAKEKFPGSIARTGCMIQKGLKRRRLSIDGSEDHNWAKILERNSIMLSSQLESQNINYQLDRDQRKEQADSLLATLNKLTDALVRIANKL